MFPHLRRDCGHSNGLGLADQRRVDFTASTNARMFSHGTSGSRTCVGDTTTAAPCRAYDPQAATAARTSSGVPNGIVVCVPIQQSIADAVALDQVADRLCFRCIERQPLRPIMPYQPTVILPGCQNNRPHFSSAPYSTGLTPIQHSPPGSLANWYCSVSG